MCASIQTNIYRLFRTKNLNGLYDRYNIEEILPKKKIAIDVGFYSELLWL